MQNANEWISGNEVARRLDVHPNAVPRVAQVAEIRRRQVPGCRARYSALDVEKILADLVSVGPKSIRKAEDR